ncbi:alpha/beta fold hydrolase [Aquabacterium sp. A08]|uniref:alpha/beta fold hydrolase n=1 Tax=Aquabacterium sp. A08 TaxID=2718532 RepID=UPI0014213488|nr:alpha/beta hydrolase [Aquabacterium sp. A08]NIC40121.1 alpha/beta hydrolase [Aquabacterium sp. A08]
MYQVLRPAHSQRVTLRSQRYHLRQWGTPTPDRAPLLLVHGWMDVSASWQFVVDALAQDRWVLAPDWRGFGQTRPLHLTQPRHPTDYGEADHYLFADYLADLDVLVDHVNTELGRPADAPIDLVGHSMGGNVAMMYGGIRPQRVRRLVNLEGFGMPATRPAQAPGRYAKWMDELKALHRGDLALKAYDDLHGVAQRLMKTNRRLPLARALWLAEHWAARNADGRWEVLGDPAHKVTSALLYQLDEVLEVFARIAAPVLAVEASDDSLAQWFTRGEYTLAQYHERLRHVPNCRTAVVADAGHMLHHDQPQAVAGLIEDFLA